VTNAAYDAYLTRPVNFGGQVVSLGDAIAAMQAEGHAQPLIDRWVQGALLAAKIHSPNAPGPGPAQR
jgi:hypothetical protein